MGGKIEKTVEEKYYISCSTYIFKTILNMTNLNNPFQYIPTAIQGQTLIWRSPFVIRYLLE